MFQKIIHSEYWDSEKLDFRILGSVNRDSGNCIYFQRRLWFKVVGAWVIVASSNQITTLTNALYTFLDKFFNILNSI